MVTGPDSDLPPGEELAWRNRRIIAERTGWPAGALEACEQIQAAHPAWDVNWRDANTIKGFEAPAGFYAVRLDARGPERATYGPDPDTLVAAIEAVRSVCPVCQVVFPIPAGGEIPLHDVDGAPCKVFWSWRTVTPQTSACPACGAEVDAPPGYDVPPHKIAPDADWCRARCSELTV